MRERQTAVFVNEGSIADVFTPGTYTLETKNLPILSDLFPLHLARLILAGHVGREFDDVLVRASTYLADKADTAGPWPLEQAVPYQPEYLAGYTAPRYDIDATDGLDIARAKMTPVIEDDARHDIGGDD